MSVEKLSDFKSEFSILVATSDKYISLMNGFLVFLKENWPDNPFNIYVSLEKKSFQPPSGLSIQLVNSHSKDWSTRIHEALKKIDTKYVLFFLEDYYIFEKINNDIIIELLKFVVRNQPHYVSYFRNPMNYFHQIKSHSNTMNLSFYEVIKGKKYLNLLGAKYIYEVDFLKGILRKNESAWEFELNASYRYFKYRKSKNYRFYIDDDPFKFLKGGIINKGEIREAAKTFLEQKSINFTWEKQKVGVSTKETPIWLRIPKKIVRSPKRFLSRHFFKF